MNTHLHLMELFTTYCEMTGDELVRERLIELIAIQGKGRAVMACLKLRRVLSAK